MRRWWIYIILYSAVGVFGLTPFCATDIAKLSPVEAIWLEEQNGFIILETDGGDIGVGKTVADALDNMKRTASATVFLDTADYLVVKRGDEKLIPQVIEDLRPSCSVCVADEKPILKTAAEFLRMHEPSVKLKNVHAEMVGLPLLQNQRGRWILIEDKGDNSTAFHLDECCCVRSGSVLCRQC